MSVILALSITLALVAIATGVSIGARLARRSHRADLIQQAACIRGEVARAIGDAQRDPAYTRALAYRRGGIVR